MSYDRTKGLSRSRKHRPLARIRTLNRIYAQEQNSETDERDRREQKKRLYPEPEPRGHYVP